MPLITPEELKLHPPPPLPYWIRRPDVFGLKVGPLLPSPEYQIGMLKPPSKSGKPGEPYWFSNPGPQTWVLRSLFDETILGGSRGGGKSIALIAWFAMGDPTLAKNDPAHYSFLLEPSYRGLILRKEYQSMAEFVDECADYYGPLGGKKKNEPVEFHFKSGAIIYTNHLGDKNAFEKYRGWGISRIGIEELTQIEEERWYLKLLGSLRAKKQVRIHGKTVFPALRSQIMSTTNPDGPGASWVRKRFVHVLDSKGKQIPWNTPMKDQFTGLTRIFIPMARKDNQYLRDDKQYEGMLLSQDDLTRRQWMNGEWASAGQFFLDWRPHGPVGEEQERYPWARHIVDGADLQPWWYRWGGGDWGYDHPAVFHKFCRSEKDSRIHAYDELILRNCPSFEVGVHLAKWWLPDLEYLPDKTVTIAFSSDAFANTGGGKTIAEQISAGIKSILGPYGAFLLKHSDEERAAMARDPGLAQEMFARRRAESAHGQFCIVLKPASKDTVARWSYMRDLIAFRPARQETEEELKQRLMQVFERAGRHGDGSSAVEAYERELAKVKQIEKQVLPKLQVWRSCAGLIRCMEEANADEKDPRKIQKWHSVEGVGGDDPLESAGQGLHHFKDVEKTMPKSYFLSESMERIQSQHEDVTGSRIDDPNRLMMIHATQAARFEQQNPDIGRSFTLPRASSGRHRGRVM